MGDSAPQANAPSLQQSLIGLDRFAQHPVAYDWAVANGRIIDMFGSFAKERHLLIFQSGNECENWIDPLLNVVYKMNTLVHTGGDILKLLERIDCYNALFRATPMRFVGFHVMSRTNIYPVFAQPFVPNATFATEEEISEYMLSKGFCRIKEEGLFENEEFVLSDIKPKNVLRSPDGTIFVIDAEIQKKTTK